MPEQAIGLVAGRKFDNGKRLAWRGLIIKRKKYGVSDGYSVIHPRQPNIYAISQASTNVP